MALDETHSVLANAFWRAARLVLLDTGSGAVTANLETCADADDVFFDSRRRIYISCGGAGSVHVFQAEAGGYGRLGRFATGPGARSSLFVPELGVR